MAKLQLGAEIDKIHAMQLQMDKFTAQANAIKEKIDAAKEKLLSKVKKAELSGAAGKKAKVSLIEQDVANVEDWDIFMSYVAKKKAFDLVQRRPSNEAVRARWAEKVKIPGLTPFRKITLRVLKK